MRLQVRFMIMFLLVLVIISLAGAETLLGTLTYKDGSRAWCGVSVLGKDGSLYLPAKHLPVDPTGVDQKYWFVFGRYELDVPPGEYTVRVVPVDGFVKASVPVTVQEGEARVCDVTVLPDEDAEPATRLRLTLKGKDNPEAARFLIHYYDAEGTRHGLSPMGVLQRNWHGDSYFWFHANTGCEIVVPADVTGPITVRAVRGTEYEFFETVITPERGTLTDIDVVLNRWINLASEGWYSGDIHTHILNTARRNLFPTPESRYPLHAVELMRAEDMRVGCFLICPNERVYSRSYYSDGPYHMKIDQEPRNSTYGHMDALLLDYAVEQYNAGREFNGCDYPSNLPLVKKLHEAGAVVAYAHPIAGPPSVLDKLTSILPAWGVNFTAICRGLPADIVNDSIEVMEIYSWSATEDANETLWYRLLNCGWDIMPAAGTDSFNGMDGFTGPTGGLRMYVRVDGDLTYEKWVRAMASGKSFMTSGPALELFVDGHQTGDTIALTAPKTLPVRVRLRSNLPVDRMEVLVGGKVVETIPVGDDWRDFEATCDVTVDKSSYVTARVRGDEPNDFLVEQEVRALTAPVFVSMNGVRRSSQEDAAYFIRWLNEFKDILKTEGVFETPDQLEEVLGELDAAKVYYEAMASK